MKSGGLKPFWPNTLDIHFGLPFSSSCHNSTCNESDESDEGRSHEVGRCNDADSGTCICCRDQWIEDKAGKGVVEALMAVACDQIEKNGSFKLGGMLNMKLK